MKLNKSVPCSKASFISVYDYLNTNVMSYVIEYNISLYHYHNTNGMSYVIVVIFNCITIITRTACHVNEYNMTHKNVKTTNIIFHFNK